MKNDGIHDLSFSKMPATEEVVMKPQDITLALRKRSWIVIGLVVLCALVAAIASYVQKPTYKVQVIMATVPPMSITTKQPDPQIAIGLQFLGNSISEAIESMEVATATSKALEKNGVKLSPEELISKVMAEHEANTTTIKMTIVDTSPTRVVEIANTWANQAAEVLNESELLLGGSIDVTNTAVPPSSPYRPKPMLYVGMGAFLGLIFGFALSVGVEYMDPHFRSSEETEDMLNLPVLGALPNLDVSPEITNKAYSGLRTTLLFAEDKEQTKSVALAPIIDFSSRAYVATNLATSIARTGRRTLLIDCDLKNKRVSELLNVYGNKGLAEILEAGSAANIYIAKTNTENLHILPAGQAGAMSSDLLSLSKFEEVLRELEIIFERIIIDGPPLTTSIDSAIMSSVTGLSLLVIDVQTCTRSMARMALDSYEHLQIRPTGVVLANLKSSKRERD